MVYDGSEVTYEDTGLDLENSTHSYKVQAVNENGESPLSPSCQCSSVYPTPQDIFFVSVTATSITLGWAGTGDGITYQLFRDTDPAGTFSDIVYDGSIPVYEDPGLDIAKDYYYRIQGTLDGIAFNMSAIASTMTIGTVEWEPLGAAYRYATNEASKEAMNAGEST